MFPRVVFIKMLTWFSLPLFHCQLDTSTIFHIKINHINCTSFHYFSTSFHYFPLVSTIFPLFSTSFLCFIPNFQDGHMWNHSHINHILFGNGNGADLGRSHPQLPSLPGTGSSLALVVGRPPLKKKTWSMLCNDILLLKLYFYVNDI